MMRTHYCTHLKASDIGQTISVCGWVHRRRNLGGLIFIHLRDRSGLLQLVFEPEKNLLFAQAEDLKNEYVLQVQGLVRVRPQGQVNAQMLTGEIEVLVSNLTVLSIAKTPPFPLEDQNASEQTRLTYRYIELRRPEIQQRLMIRHHITRVIRQYFDELGFVDVETPVLTRATPEGARDYLVPSRTHRGSFFALPQSPQLFKQILMIAGFDRYYQIVKCFRDEDLRADRQPEFTQLDVEMSFVEEADVMSVIENLLMTLFKKILSIDLPSPLPRMTYQEAMSRFASDKPDLRIPLELVDIADLVKDSTFKAFAAAATGERSRVVVLKIPQGAEKLSRKMLDQYTDFVATYGLTGLGYLKVNQLEAGLSGLQSSLLKLLPEVAVFEILKRAQAKNTDLLLFGAGHESVLNPAMGALRNKLGADLNLYTQVFAPLWVTDFPMFEENNGTWQAKHHPFTAPKISDATALADANKHDLLSRAYDLVINGYEIGGGSIRIHDSQLQLEVFKLLNLSETKAQEKFGFLLEALQCGVPPHGGFAWGLDRIVMVMTGTDNIREVIAFPKTQTASCLMTQAPSSVEPSQLLELGIQVIPSGKLDGEL